MTTDDLQQVQRTRLFEIFNGHPQVNNQGGGGVPGLEESGTVLLISGRLMYGVAVDDAHHFKRPGDPPCRARARLDLRPRGTAGGRRWSRRSSGVTSTRLPVSSFAYRCQRRGVTLDGARRTPWSKYRVQFIGRAGACSTNRRSCRRITHSRATKATCARACSSRTAVGVDAACSRGRQRAQVERVTPENQSRSPGTRDGIARRQRSRCRSGMPWCSKRPRASWICPQITSFGLTRSIAARSS